MTFGLFPLWVLRIMLYYEHLCTGCFVFVFCSASNWTQVTLSMVGKHSTPNHVASPSCISFMCESVFLVFLGTLLGVELLDQMATLNFTFEEPPDCFPAWLHHFIFVSVLYEDNNFFTSLPTLVFVVIIIIILWGVKQHLIVGFSLYFSNGCPPLCIVCVQGDVTPYIRSCHSGGQLTVLWESSCKNEGES